jgi:hypothetical protein
MLLSVWDFNNAELHNAFGRTIDERTDTAKQCGLEVVTGRSLMRSIGHYSDSMLFIDASKLDRAYECFDLYSHRAQRSYLKHVLKQTVDVLRDGVKILAFDQRRWVRYVNESVNDQVDWDKRREEVARQAKASLQSIVEGRFPSDCELEVEFWLAGHGVEASKSIFDTDALFMKIGLNERSSTLVVSDDSFSCQLDNGRSVKVPFCAITEATQVKIGIAESPQDANNDRTESNFKAAVVAKARADRTYYRSKMLYKKASNLLSLLPPDLQTKVPEAAKQLNAELRDN